MQRDLKLYVACKLEKPLHNGVPEWENDMMLFDALNPSVPSKYGLQSPNRTMLQLLVDKGVDLNKPLVDGDVGPPSIWDQVIAQIEPQWSHTDAERKVQQLEIINALLECGAESNRSAVEVSHKWVDVLLSPHSWCSHNMDFEAALTKAVVALCGRGIDLSWRFDGLPLWLHFIRSIFCECQSPRQLSLKTKGHIMVIVKTFLGLGAQLNDKIHHEAPFDTYSTVAGLLARIFSPTEMEGLESLQTRVKAESSNTKTSSAQRRKKKKRRKERKRERDIETIG